MYKKLRTFSAGVLTISVLLVLAFSRSAHGQSPASSETNAVTFRLDPATEGAPVEISGILIGNRPIPIDQPANVGSDWLRKLTVLVKNTSSKTIIEGGVDVSFPESGRGTVDDPIEAQGAYLGRYPDEALFAPDGSRIPRPEWQLRATPLTAKPGSILSFSFAGSVTDTLSFALKRAGRITQVTVRLRWFYFDDGSRWSPGYFAVPGDSPGRWRQLTPDEFREYATHPSSE